MAKGSWRFRVSRWMVVLGLFLGGLVAASARPALAQEEEKEVALPPLVVINVAGADRLLGDVNYMFETIGRDDLKEVINGFLGNVGDLKGLDRTKSLGVMLYFKPGFPPAVDPVGFVPVDNIGDLLKTIELGPVKTKKIPGEENRYQLDGINGNDPSLHVLLQGGYAYVSNNAAAFDRELPDPGPLTQSLTQRYDLAASVNIEGIPEGMRTIFLDFLRAQTEAEMQQRDNEPEASYRARKAGAMNNLKNIEAIIKDGRSLTIGLDASKDAKAVVIELDLKAKPSSGLAKELKKFPGKPSVFANAYSEQIPLAATGSWNLTTDDKQVFTEAVKAIEAGITDGMKQQNLDPTPLEGIVKSLESTINTGSVDFFAQFVGEPPGKFALVGGLKIDRTADFASGLQGIIQQLNKLPEIAEMQINAETHNGVGLHRILGKATEGDSDNQWLFGGLPAFYVGAGRGAVWFGIGKEGTAEQLKKAMTLVEAIPTEHVGSDRIAPFQVVLNLSSWIGLSGDGENAEPQNVPPAGDDQEAQRRAARRAARVADRKARMTAARDAFKPENDRLMITARPVQDGFRLRLQFDEGFIRFLGLRISHQLDQSQL